MRRLGVLMSPDPSLPEEVEGVLNPASARGPDGKLYLFPRRVGRGNHSEIGVGRVKFDRRGEPSGVDRLGVVLAPETDYETWPDGRGGVEDPRITFVAPLQHWVMTYTAWSPLGPRIAVARSDDLFQWERLGLARFHPFRGLHVDDVDNKDAVIFPHLIEDPARRMSIAMLHRPLFAGSRPHEVAGRKRRRAQLPEHESIWISYWHWRDVLDHPQPLGRQFVAHRLLAQPRFEWESLKIGSGAPPVLCRHGWLLIYHGVSDGPVAKHTYSAGVMILDREFPHRVLYRSPEPVLRPETTEEIEGVVADVVFPTGVDRRDDIGQPDRFDVYYGMADDRIGVATLTVPETLPSA
jgi:predicted GH43/DUF377 family glycosyl hydrolase